MNCKNTVFAGKTKLKVKQACITRWNSEYLMLERFMELKDELTLALLKLKSDFQMLNLNELIILEKIIQVLKPIYDYTIRLSDEKVTNISPVIPQLICLKFNYSSLNFQDVISTELRKTTLSNLNTKLSHLE